MHTNNIKHRCDVVWPHPLCPADENQFMSSRILDSKVCLFIGLLLYLSLATIVQLVCVKPTDKTYMVPETQNGICIS